LIVTIEQKKRDNDYILFSSAPWQWPADAVDGQEEK
jgi:hypothetical protein